jgi:hypothetical protein
VSRCLDDIEIPVTRFTRRAMECGSQRTGEDGVSLTASAPVAGVSPRPAASWTALMPALLWLAVRVVGSLIVWGMTAAAGRVNVRPWDADWYLRIAEHGYRAAATDMVDMHGTASPAGAFAFFPGYPLAVRVFAPVVGHNYLVAGFVVSALAGVAGAFGVARVARLLWGDRRAELIAVVLVAAAPMSVVYTIAYPEVLLLALAAWTLVVLIERRWWAVCPLVAAAGLTSPMAAPLIAVVMVAAVAAVFRGWGGWAAAVAALVAPTGLLGYLLYVDVSSGVPGGYFAISAAGWGNRIDFGVTTVRWVYRAFTGNRDAFEVMTAAAIVAAVAAVVMLWRRLPLPVWAYTVGVVALVVVHSGLVQDRVRLLLAAFPLLVLGAVRLSRARTRVAVAVTVVVSLAGLWFSGYALAVWPYAI